MTSSSLLPTYRDPALASASFPGLVPWESLAAAIGLPIRGRALPLILACPLCHQPTSLHLFHDNSEHGVWHHCYKCRSSGSLLTLAAKRFQTTPSGVVTILASRGLRLPDGPGRKIVLARMDRDEACRQYRLAAWSEAGKALENDQNENINHLRWHHGLRWDHGHRRWLSGPANLVGSMSPDELATALSGIPGRKRQKDFPFRGKSWGRLLVVAFFDKPGNICGFLAEGYREDTITQAYLPCSYLPEHDYGISGTDRLAENDSDVLATSQLDFYLRLHFQHFANSLIPLPLVLWRHDEQGRTRNSWWQVGDRLLTFLPDSPEPVLFLQAISSGGRIATGHHAKSKAWQGSHHGSYHFFRQAVDYANNWSDCLMKWTEQQPSPKLVSFVQDLEQEGIDTRQRLGPFLPWNRLPRHEPLFRYLRLSSRCVISERDDGWYVGPDPTQCDELVLNCTLRALAVIRDKDSQEQFVYGRIAHQRRSIPFIAPLATFQKCPVDLIQAKLAENDLGPIVVHPDYERHLYRITMLMHPPDNRHDDLWRWTKRLNLVTVRDRRGHSRRGLVA